MSQSTTPTPAIVLAERKRCLSIRNIAAKSGLTDEWATKHINSGESVGNVALAALDEQKRSPEHMSLSTNTVYAGADRRDTIGDAISDAISLRMGAKLKNVNPQAAEFQGRSLAECGRIWLLAAGVHEASRMSAAQIASRLFKSRGLALAQATGDFPNLLADSLGKSLRAEYTEAAPTWRAWCKTRTVPDFKEVSSPALYSFPTPIVKPEGMEIEYSAIPEGSESYKIATYSRGTKITREAIVNDDTSAFDRIPRLMTNACTRLESDLVYGILTANAAMADNIALFATGHNNIGTGVINNANVSAGRVKMALQTDPQGVTLNLKPKFLIVPVGLEDVALQHVASQEIRSTEADTTYVTNQYSFMRTLQVISESRLDQSSSAQWYLAADPQMIDTIEVAFLEGEEVPVVEEEDEFDTDTRRIKIRHNVGAQDLDHRGLYRSSGS